MRRFIGFSYKMDKRSITSALNGRKGGRKKGAATIEREKLKEYIAQKIAENGEQIVSVLLEKALTGDIMSIRELFDRGFGKPSQAVEMSGKDGKDLFEPSERLKQLADILNEIHARGNSASS